MGRTAIFLPGIENAGALDVVVSAADVPEGALLAPTATANVDDAETVEDAGDELEGGGVAAAAATGDEADEERGVVEEACEDPVVDDAAAGVLTDEKPLTEIAGLPAA